MTRFLCARSHPLARSEDLPGGLPEDCQADLPQQRSFVAAVLLEGSVLWLLGLLESGGN